MHTVLLRVSTELLSEMLALGPNRLIVGAFVRDDLARTIVFQIADTEAPDGTTELSPFMYREDDGSVRMDPHYS
jgi:hypothetical protein